MKLVSLFTLLTFVCPLLATDDSMRPTDPFGGALFRPELVLQAHDVIGLSAQQRSAIEEKGKATLPRIKELRAKLDRESAALAALAKPERVEEAALAAQLDKVLDLERELKHLHLGALTMVKNLLTPEQQAKLREIANDGAKKIAADLRQRLAGKVERVQAGVQKWAQSGRDPSVVVETIAGKIKPLINAGKIREAEAELDRLLEDLNK